MLLDRTTARQAIPRKGATPWLLRDGALWLIWAMGMTAVILLTAVIWQRSQIVSLGYETERLSRSYDDAVQENRRLKVEVNSLNAVERIGQIAERQLHMRPAQPHERAYVVLPVHAPSPAPSRVGGPSAEE
jgi:cell division protein FtsL